LIIPKRLQHDDFRFVKVAKGGKNPIEMSWQDKNNYKWNSSQIKEHVEKGGNYGVLGGFGNLVIIDCDSREVENSVKNSLPDTFTVRTGGGGAHFYYICNDLSNPIRLSSGDSYGDIGDVQSKGKQVIGAGSTHPNGNKYKVENDINLAKIDAESIRVALKDYIKTESHVSAREEKSKLQEINKDLDISILSVVDTAGLKHRGDEFQGSHPIHGSSTGMNFCVNPGKNTWHCFRCSSGGGPLSWMAVKEGIISCSDATPGALRGEIFKKVLDVGKKKYGLKVEEEKPKLNIYEEDGKFQPSLLAEDILNDIHAVTVTDNSTIYYYNSGIYHRDPDENRVKERMRKKIPNITKHELNEAIEYIKNKTLVTRDVFDKEPYLIWLKNGIYNLQTNELERFDPKKISTNQIPVIFDSQAKCPKIMAFLKDLVKEEDVSVLQEMVGYCLYKKYPIARAFMFVGGGKNGKSTFLNLLVRFLGVENIATPSLHALIYDRFAKVELYNKLANIHADLSASKLKHTGNFKMLTGGDWINAERKFKHPFKFKNYAKLIYSANELPYSEDTTDAFFRRWIIVEFPYIFDDDGTNGYKKKDPNIINKITTEEEMSGFFNWAIEGLKRVLKHGKFTRTKTTDHIKEEWLVQTDPLKVFVEKRVREIEGIYITKEDFYEEYLKFCEKNNAPMVEKGIITRQLPRLVKSIRASRRRIDGNRKRCWDNIVVFDKNGDTLISCGTFLPENEKNDENSKVVKKIDSFINDNNNWSKKSNKKSIPMIIEKNIKYNINKECKNTLDFLDRVSTGNEGVKEKIIDFFRENPNSKYFDCVFELSKQNIDEEGQKVFEIFEDLKKKGVIHEPRKGEFRLVNS